MLAAIVLAAVAIAYFATRPRQVASSVDADEVPPEESVSRDSSSRNQALITGLGSALVGIAGTVAGAA